MTRAWSLVRMHRHSNFAFPSKTLTNTFEMIAEALQSPEVQVVQDSRQLREFVALVELEHVLAGLDVLDTEMTDRHSPPLHVAHVPLDHVFETIVAQVPDTFAPSLTKTKTQLATPITVPSVF